MSLASSAFSESAFAAFGVSPNVYENVTGLSATASVDDELISVVAKATTVITDVEQVPVFRINATVNDVTVSGVSNFTIDDGLSATASVDDDSPVVVGESILVASDFEVTATLDDGFIVQAESNTVLGGLSATASVDDDSPVVVGESILVASDFEVTATLDDGFIVVAEALAIVDGTNLQAIVTVESDLPTVTGGAVVLATASQVTGQVGQPLVWGEIPVSQTPNYSVLAPDQTPSYTEISPSSDVTWADRAA